jgi:hypothetical protein
MKQDIYQVSPVGVPAYPIGARHALDLRVFHYARAGGVLTPDFAAKNANFQHVTWAVVAPAAIGARAVVVTVGATDGAARNGAIGLNELAGGYAAFFPAIANQAMNRRIISNTAVAAPGGAMTVVVDKPLTVALTAVSRFECIASIFSNVQITPVDSTYCSVVGVPTINAIAGQFLWIQTWGPLWTNADLVVSVGINNRAVGFGPDGNMHPIVAADAFNTTQGQRAGFALDNGNTAAHLQGSPFVFLQLFP